MEVTPLIPDWYKGPIKKLTCKNCQHVFYLAIQDYKAQPLCHECSVELSTEAEQARLEAIVREDEERIDKLLAEIAESRKPKTPQQAEIKEFLEAQHPGYEWRTCIDHSRSWDVFLFNLTTKQGLSYFVEEKEGKYIYHKEFWQALSELSTRLHIILEHELPEKK